MNRRIENKIDVDVNKKIILFNWLQEKKAKKIYETRQINSIYFDNSKYTIYDDSVEGISPRKKIRVRFYGNFKDNNKQKIEIKYTFPYGRYKSTKEINTHSNIFDTGYLDDLYGVCMPKTIVSYKRTYFKLGFERLTFDEDITYAKYNKNLNNLTFVSDPKIILEVKSNNFVNIDEIEQNIPFKTTRFSKYCESVEKLNLII